MLDLHAFSTDALLRSRSGQKIKRSRLGMKINMDVRMHVCMYMYASLKDAHFRPFALSLFTGGRPGCWAVGVQRTSCRLREGEL